MQFAYQFPQLVERLILVGAGGVTKDVNVALRIASLPMGSEALALLRLAAGAARVAGRRARRPARCSDPPALGRDLPDVLRILADLPEPTASSAFARTLRAVVDWRGQVVTMLDRCYLTQSVPVQLIWGSRRFGDPGQPRPDGARRDARFAARDLRGLRALPVPRRPRPLRRGRRAVHRLHRTRRLRPGLPSRICCAPASARARSPARSTPGSRCSTRWVPTSAAPPDRRPPALPAASSIGPWPST